MSRSTPPQGLVTAVNPLVRALAYSPLHRILDRYLVVLHVTGRRSGRTYDIPVGYTRLGDTLLVITQHRWRRNLRSAPRIDVTFEGRRRPMQAYLEESPDSVGRTMQQAIDVNGWPETRRRFGIDTGSGAPPSPADLVNAAREHDLAVVTLRPVHD